MEYSNNKIVRFVRFWNCNFTNFNDTFLLSETLYLKSILLLVEKRTLCVSVKLSTTRNRVYFNIFFFLQRYSFHEGEGSPEGREYLISQILWKHGRKVLSTIFKNVYTPSRLHLLSFSLPSSCTFLEKEKRKKKYISVFLGSYIFITEIYLFDDSRHLFCSPWVIKQQRI